MTLLVLYPDPRRQKL